LSTPPDTELELRVSPDGLRSDACDRADGSIANSFTHVQFNIHRHPQ
jgi:hypothetical protein